MFTSLSDKRYVTKHSNGSSSFQTESTEWVAFSPDGKTLAVSSQHRGEQIGSVKLVNIESETVSARTPDVYGRVRFLNDGKSLVVGGYTGLHVIDAESGKVLRTLRAESGVLALDVSHDGRSLVCGDTRGRLQLWEIETGKQLWEASVMP